MKIRYALLGPVVVAALTPGVIWAQTAGRAMAQIVQQSALGHGESEQKSPDGLLGRSDEAGTQADQNVALGSRKNAKPGPANVPATKSSQRAESSLAHSPKAAKHSTLIKAPAAAALPGSTKARAPGVAGSQHRNSSGAVSSVKYGGPVPTRPGPGALMAREPRVLTAPRPGSSALGGGTPPAPANVVARHSPVSAALGGAPASYEPPRNATLAVIGGTMMKRNKL